MAYLVVNPEDRFSRDEAHISLHRSPSHLYIKTADDVVF